MGSITAANSVFTIQIDNLYTTPQVLQGYSADEVFTTAPLASAEVLMGIDGFFTGGFVYVPFQQTISLQADSTSNLIFDGWWGAQQAISDLYFASGVITLPSIQRQWTLTRGILTTYPPIPDAMKVLRPRKYGVTWRIGIPSNTTV